MVQAFCHNLLLKLGLLLLRFNKPRFGKWIRLEEQKSKILEAVGETRDDFPNRLFEFLSTALYFDCRKANWINVISAFYEVLKLTQYQISLPIFEPSKDDVKKDSWDYDGRTAYLYSHRLAKTYGWTLEYINNLKVMDVLPLVQEIATDEQLEKEWDWNTTEFSVTYDPKTKTSKMNPLPRPNWMNKHIDPETDIKKVKIPKDMIPVGHGYSYADLKASLPAS